MSPPEDVWTPIGFGLVALVRYFDASTAGADCDFVHVLQAPEVIQRAEAIFHGYRSSQYLYNVAHEARFMRENGFIAPVTSSRVVESTASLRTQSAMLYGVSWAEGKRADEIKRARRSNSVGELTSVRSLLPMLVAVSGK